MPVAAPYLRVTKPLPEVATWPLVSGASPGAHAPTPCAILLEQSAAKAPGASARTTASSSAQGPGREKEPGVAELGGLLLCWPWNSTVPLRGVGAQKVPPKG